MSCCDVLVIGAGPAGMAGAIAAAEAGCRTIVVDDNPAPGGQIWRGHAGKLGEPQPRSGGFADLVRRLDAAHVEVVAGTRVVAQPAPGVLRLESDAGCTDLQYAKLILANGARERFLPFPGWTLPGVLGAGGLQAMVTSGLAIAGKRVVLAGSGPLLIAVAVHLADQGARIAGVFEQAPLRRLVGFGAGLIAYPGKLLEGVRYRAAMRLIPYHTNAWVTRATGDDRLRSVSIRVGEGRREIGCDYLGCGFHLVPNLELPRMLGCAIDDGYVRVDALQQSSVPHVYCAGELTGVGGLEKALAEGEIAGLGAAGRPAGHLHARRKRYVGFAQRLNAAFALRPELNGICAADTIVCRCEDVRRAALEGMRSGREAKLHTRCGMGPCQGRICGPATSFLFGWDNESVRPPVSPARLSTLSEVARPAAVVESES